MKNKIFGTIIIGCLLLIAAAQPAKADSILSIQSLPEYITTNDFMISCTSNAPSVTFSFNRHGGTTYTFATVDLTTSPCRIHITPTQITEQTDYTFTVSDGVTSVSTTTIYDTLGPAPVTGYSKERVNNGQYRIHWTNPGDTDFARVIIYRGDATGFEADSSHELTKVAGAGNAEMTYDDYFSPDPSKNYYYLIRALDKAGNSSGLVGDGGETITTTPVPAVSAGNIILPKESPSGSVLGTEATPSPTPTPSISTNMVNKINNFAAKTPEPFHWILTHKKITLGILLLVAGSAYLVLNLIKKRK